MDFIVKETTNALAALQSIQDFLIKNAGNDACLTHLEMNIQLSDKDSDMNKQTFYFTNGHIISQDEKRRNLACALLYRRMSRDIECHIQRLENLKKDISEIDKRLHTAREKQYKSVSKWETELSKHLAYLKTAEEEFPTWMEYREAVKDDNNLKYYSKFASFGNETIQPVQALIVFRVPATKQHEEYLVSYKSSPRFERVDKTWEPQDLDYFDMGYCFV